MAARIVPFLEHNQHARPRLLEVRTEAPRKVLLWDAPTIEWIWRSDTTFGHPGSRSMRPVLGTDSMLWLDGERHTMYRKTLSPFLNGRALRGYRDTISSITESAIDRHWSVGSEVPIAEWTRGITLSIISRVLLGSTDSDVLARFSEWMEDVLGSTRRIMMYRYLKGGLPPASASLDEALLDAARAADYPSIARVLLDESGPLGNLDDREVRDQIVTLLFAGHETTASSIATALVLLDRHPKVRAELLDELDATSADGMEGNEVPLLQATAREVLRLRPPVPVAANREMTEPGEICGRQLPAGTMLSPCPFLAHREHFDRADRFDPHRFLGKRPATSEFFPFGGGKRHCLGSQLAEAEIRMIVAAVLRRRSWQCVAGRGSTEQRQQRVHTLAPAPRVKARVTGHRAR
ncbi:cytochrome P450 [Tamaricihabitans halophyticus]|nr:cytochrome P450 [Tamaricihabitans halophyticus]